MDNDLMARRLRPPSPPTTSQDGPQPPVRPAPAEQPQAGQPAQPTQDAPPSQDVWPTQGAPPPGWNVPPMPGPASRADVPWDRPAREAWPPGDGQQPAIQPWHPTAEPADPWLQVAPAQQPSAPDQLASETPWDRPADEQAWDRPAAEQAWDRPEAVGAFDDRPPEMLEAYQEMVPSARQQAPAGPTSSARGDMTMADPYDAMAPVVADIGRLVAQAPSISRPSESNGPLYRATLREAPDPSRPEQSTPQMPAAPLPPGATEPWAPQPAAAQPPPNEPPREEAAAGQLAQPAPESEQVALPLAPELPVSAAASPVETPAPAAPAVPAAPAQPAPHTMVVRIELAIVDEAGRPIAADTERRASPRYVPPPAPAYSEPSAPADGEPGTSSWMPAQGAPSRSAAQPVPPSVGGPLALDWELPAIESGTSFLPAPWKAPPPPPAALPAATSAPRWAPGGLAQPPPTPSPMSPSSAPVQPAPAIPRASRAATAPDPQADLRFLSQPAATASVDETAEDDAAEPKSSTLLTAGLTVAFAILVIVLVLVFVQLMTSLLR